MAFVTLAWDANTDAGVTGYRVHYGTSSRSYTLNLDAGSATTATVNGLSPSYTYYFAVEAYNSGGTESAPSNEVSFTTPGGTVGDIYFGFRTDGQAGGGTGANDPIDCTTHSQMDAAMDHYNVAGNTLHFAGGTYQWTGATIAAPGSPGTLTLFSNTSWLGAATGTDTVFQLVNSAVSSCFLSNGANGWLSNVTVQDITFDCQGNGNPGNASYNAALLCGGADHLTIQRCTFSNFCTGTNLGDLNVVRVFGGSASDASGHTMQNVLVDSCTFVSPSRGNKGGAYLVALGFALGVAVTPSTLTVSNCIFDTCDADFTFLRCIANAPTVKNNYATQCQTLYYFGPQVAHTYPILIDSNRLEACNAGMVLLWDAASAGGPVDGSQNPVCTTGPITLRNNTYSRRKLVTGSGSLNGLSGSFFRVVNNLAYTGGAHDTGTNYYVGPPSNASLLIEKNWILDYAYSTTGFPMLDLHDPQATQGIALNQVVVRRNLFSCAPGLEMTIDQRKGATGVLRQFQAIGNTTVPQDGGDRSVHLNDQILKMITVCRYGCQVFYDDSWGANNTPPNAYSSDALRTLVNYAKNILGLDVLFLPEAYGSFSTFSASAPYRDATKSVINTPDQVLNIWPNARAAIRWENSSNPVISMFPPTTKPTGRPPSRRSNNFTLPAPTRLPIAIRARRRPRK
jgi:hypothetical protein